MFAICVVFIPVVVVHIDFDHLVVTMMRILLILIHGFVTFWYFCFGLGVPTAFGFAHTNVSVGCSNVDLLGLFAIPCVMAKFATIVASFSYRVMMTLIMVVFLMVAIGIR